jgi:NADH:ubiquinone oxidoreductase subunit E
MKPPEIDWNKIHEIIEKHKGEKWGLIPLLQEVQEHTGYIPPEAIEPIAEAMNLFPSEVQGVITFYDAKRAETQRRRNQPGLSIYTGNGCLSGGLFSGAHHDDQPGLFR